MQKHLLKDLALIVQAILNCLMLINNLKICKKLLMGSLSYLKTMAPKIKLQELEKFLFLNIFKP
jgi:hypothetical protein